MQRRQRAWRRVYPVPPENGVLWPGTLPPDEVVPPDPTALPIARFVGRRAILAEGVSWLEGRIEAGEARQRIARLFLEGEAPEMLVLATELAITLPLLPAPFGLAEAALALAEGRAPRHRRAGPPSLAGAEGIETALLAALAHLLDVLLAETPGCRLGAGPRGVHQSRVAIRRMRSLLKLFRPVVDGPGWREWDAELRGLAQALGAARDWDVFLMGIGPGALGALGGDTRLKRLLATAARERDAAYAALGVLLAGAAFRRTIWLGLQLGQIRSGTGLDQPLAPFAAEVLRKRWRRLKRAGAAMEQLDSAALHEMRLDAKRLRYAAEPFAAIWPGRAAKRFTRRLAELQEALGLANDATVARQLAMQLAGRGAGGFAIGTVTGFAAGRAEGSRIAAIGAWAALRKAKPFWKARESLNL
ncbi:CHAD domain-containing protein [Sediminicoccus sp. KRV36]|uniref:CHAD domain-containing protein n=1 Tax=Sediminicoccus sp. KRV36 TaxID=3133721 RepID=UPI00200F316B|nr:CHAD domain-containing protein [Sediminicoccus rosea]UPY34944.1 CHAD domain-containing protein [Sediminicoccus rosea]